MRLIRPEDWRPTGIDDLESSAWNALRHAGSACVVAGPGAGKTEFLAQRADYLLETGLCRAPHRVLAISFKSDAANNLAARVRKRCPPGFAYRFVSVSGRRASRGNPIDPGAALSNAGAPSDLRRRIGCQLIAAERRLDVIEFCQLAEALNLDPAQLLRVFVDQEY